MIHGANIQFSRNFALHNNGGVAQWFRVMLRRQAGLSAVFLVKLLCKTFGVGRRKVTIFIKWIRLFLQTK